MGAAPAAGGAAAVRSFCDGEVAYGVVDHHRAGTQAFGDGFASAGVAGPYAGREREGRIVRACDSFFRVRYCLNRKYGTEGFFLKRLHGGIDVGDDRGLEEIWSEVNARMSAAKNACATADGVFNEIDHALYMVRANHGT